jgi:hypothetical protein
MVCRALNAGCPALMIGKKKKKAKEEIEMKCSNCLNEIPEHATACMYCEERTRPPITQERIEAIRQIQSDLPPEIKQAMDEMVQQYETAEDFVAAVLTGACPKCGSQSVRDCEKVMGRNDPTVGMCLDCGQHWCLECGYMFADQNDACPHWAICEECQSSQENPEHGCLQDSSDCLQIREAMQSWDLPFTGQSSAKSEAASIPPTHNQLRLVAWTPRPDNEPVYDVRANDGRTGVLRIEPGTLDLVLSLAQRDGGPADIYVFTMLSLFPADLLRDMMDRNGCGAPTSGG